MATFCQQLFIGTLKHKTHLRFQNYEDFFFFLNQRFGGYLGRYLVLMETKPKILNKSLWNQDGLSKYSLSLVMPNLGLWDLKQQSYPTKCIIPNTPVGLGWVGLGWVESCKQRCQTYYLYGRYTNPSNVTSQDHGTIANKTKTNGSNSSMLAIYPNDLSKGDSITMICAGGDDDLLGIHCLKVFTFFLFGNNIEFIIIVRK